jgi:hypothetical protein
MDEKFANLCTVLLKIIRSEMESQKEKAALERDRLPGFSLLFCGLLAGDPCVDAVA